MTSPRSVMPSAGRVNHAFLRPCQFLASPAELDEYSHLTATSLPEDYSYAHRAACIGPDDLTVGEKVGLLCVPHSRRGEIAVDVGVMMCSWSPYVLRPAEGLAAHVAAGAVPKAYCRFLS